MALYVYYFCPETSGLSLEAVDVIFTEDYTGWRGAVKKSVELRDNAKKSGHKTADLENLHLSHRAGGAAAMSEKEMLEKVEEVHIEDAFPRTD